MSGKAGGSPENDGENLRQLFSSGSAPAAKHTFKTSNPLQLLNIGININATAALFGQHSWVRNSQENNEVNPQTAIGGKFV